MSILRSTKVQYIVPHIFKGGYNLQHISVKIFLLIDVNCNVHMVPSKIIYLRYIVRIYIFISLSHHCKGGDYPSIKRRVVRSLTGWLPNTMFSKKTDSGNLTFLYCSLNDGFWKNSDNSCTVHIILCNKITSYMYMFCS